MLKKIILFIFFLFYFPFFISPVFAEESTLPNNKFGIHLAQPDDADIQKAADLVNSNGGDWGYITLVVQENDRDLHKWQGVMDQLRRNHLIPIIRLATKPDGDKWRRPEKSEAQEWANFLNSLNWVTKNRYVILFNEPNHGQEWGGSIDIDNYTEVAQAFASTLKEKNPDFVTMLAGLDASAPSGQPEHEDEYIFLQRLMEKISPKEFENLFSAFSSHAYPNPAFSGSPWDSGRRSIRGYQWELQILKELGVNKELPVFITETGWSAERLSRDQVGNYFEAAYTNVWLPDKRVFAVTPFVLNYQGEPFLQFSWKMYQSPDFYPQYEKIKNLTKTSGTPEIREKGELEFIPPHELVEQSFYHFKINLVNSGQGYWDKLAGYQIRLADYQGEYIFSDIRDLEPNYNQNIDLFIKTNLPGKKKTTLTLSKNGQEIIKKDWQYEVLPLPKMSLAVELLPKMKSEGKDLEIQIFDDKENLVFSKNKINLNEGKAVVERIQNIIFGNKYRVVLLKPYYLPRQAYLTFQKTDNTLKFKRMLPLDFNADGKFSWEDLGALFKNPRPLKNWLP